MKALFFNSNGKGTTRKFAFNWAFHRTLFILLVMMSNMLINDARSAVGQSKPIVIAHRGASGYLPEHTLASKVLAYGMGADFIEQDVVLTRDDVPIVLHDICLDAVTDVAKVFPKRARPDGRFYAIDFSIEEIKRLSVHERIDLDSGQPVYPNRFPSDRGRFRVPTLAEEIELILGLNRSTGRKVGIYPEIKSPSWHRKQGKDISRVVVDLLANYGYRSKLDPVYLQCFDIEETRRIRTELNCELKLVQLIGNKEKDDALITPKGLDQIAEYANGIGPSLSHVVRKGNGTDEVKVSELVKFAHQRGLVVHPYTFRTDALPDYVDSFEELVSIFIDRANVDGVFTDFPDRVVQQVHPAQPRARK